MKYLDYLKQYTNFDNVVVLFDELGFTDEEIMSKLEVSKQTIYNAQKRQEPLIKALSDVADPKAIQYGNPDINTIVEAFKQAFGTTSASRFDRFAAKRLADKHGAENIVTVINALSSRAGAKFAPSVNSVSELEKKWVSVGKFLNNESNDVMIEL